MNELDVYYRALLGYRKLTGEDSKCTALRTAIADASQEGDKIVIKTATCTIEEDWVEAIERGLVHVEKAIKEERQFIRSNGEVIPIEKVKHVSKESVEHLARHSDLISRYEEGEDIIPDKLYTVERLSDYAVYENRFLYMLLCYLRDFVTLRYNDILDLTNRYDATVQFDKEISTGKEKLKYKLSMHDIRRDDPYLKEHNPAKDIIDRIDLILKAILAFLATPLMEEVGKTPMLKPPITKTNVLKMNNNFKGAMALYDFIVSYDKKGYTIIPNEHVIAPFRDELADEMAEAGGIVSFLTYEWGLGIKQELKEEYLREEERRAAEKIKQRAERIASMKRKLKSSGVGIEEYVITLEKQLRALEGEAVRAEKLADEVDKLRKNEKRLTLEITALNEEIAGLKQTVSDERQRHFEEMEALKRAHEDEMHALIVKHEEEIRALTESYEAKISDLIAEHERKISELCEKHEGEMSELRAKHEAELAEILVRMEEARREHRAAMEELRRTTDEEIATARTECASAIEQKDRELLQKSEELRASREEYGALLDEKNVTDARIKAIVGVERDHTDKLSFDQLEAEFEAFKKLYRAQWQKAKKQIRKNHINIDNIKGQS